MALGVEVEVLKIASGPDVRSGLRATVRRGRERHEVALADLAFPEEGELAAVIAAYRRWR